MHDMHDQLRSILEACGQPELGAYFAIPEVSPATGRVEWSVDTNSSDEVIPLSKLEPDQRKKILSGVQYYHGQLSDLSKKLAGNSSTQTHGRLLETLIEPPDKRHIYSVGGRPVYIYWSHLQEDPVPEIYHPRLERVDQNARPNAPTGGVGQVTEATHGVTPPDVTDTVVVFRDTWVAFVGSVSFFGIAFASILLSFVALYYLLSGSGGGFLSFG